MSRLRKRVSDRLKQAQNTYAMLTTFNEVDMTNLMVRAPPLLGRTFTLCQRRDSARDSASSALSAFRRHTFPQLWRGLISCAGADVWG
jgi:hypothetical protein